MERWLKFDDDFHVAIKRQQGYLFLAAKGRKMENLNWTSARQVERSFTDKKTLKSLQLYEFWKNGDHFQKLEKNMRSLENLLIARRRSTWDFTSRSVCVHTDKQKRRWHRWRRGDQVLPRMGALKKLYVLPCTKDIEGGHWWRRGGDCVVSHNARVLEDYDGHAERDV